MLKTPIPTPALPGSGSEGMISARNLGHPYLCFGDKGIAFFIFQNKILEDVFSIPQIISIL
jgi:hypothetical protein